MRPNCIIFFFFFLLSCTPKKRKISIHPINPYENIIKIRETNGLDGYQVKTKYYVIEGNTSDTSRLRPILMKFIDSVKRNDATSYRSYGIWFFKSNKIINRNFKETEEDLLASHSEELLAEATWQDEKFVGLFFYKDGKLITGTEDVQLK